MKEKKNAHKKRFRDGDERIASQTHIQSSMKNKLLANSMVVIYLFACMMMCGVPNPSVYWAQRTASKPLSNGRNLYVFLHQFNWNMYNNFDLLAQRIYDIQKFPSILCTVYLDMGSVELVTHIHTHALLLHFLNTYVRWSSIKHEGVAQIVWFQSICTKKKNVNNKNRYLSESNSRKNDNIKAMGYTNIHTHT